MSVITTGTRSDVTVLLLGHEQADTRARAHYYYSQVDVPCVALESLQAGSTGEVCRQRLLQALHQVTTPLVVLSLDADFILPVALDNAAAHLQAAPQAIGAQGYALGYTAGNCEFTYHKIGSALLPSAEQSAHGRLQRYTEAAQPAWRAVLRVSALKAVLPLLPESVDFPTWRLALSYALLTHGEIERLEQTDAVTEYVECPLSAALLEERLTLAVRTLREWDAAGAGLCSDDFDLLNRFVRGTYGASEEPLLFTSAWRSVTAAPERVFAPQQYVALPYYNSALFDCLVELEFLCHAWPAGEQHYRSLEGAWVRQRELLTVHANDTPASLQQRYWQALALGLFNREVCLRLEGSLVADSDARPARELQDWCQRLAKVPALSPEQGLAATPSGQLLELLDTMTPDTDARQRVLDQLAQSQPQVAFVVLDLANDDVGLQATFDSLLASGVRNFKLWVLKAGKPLVITTPQDTLHFVQVTPDNWVAHLNQVVRQLPSEWLMLLHAGEQLLVGGLLHLLWELRQSPACQAICAHEVQRDEQGRLHNVARPGADLDLLRSQPRLMSRHWLVRRQAVLELGGYSESQRQALEFDLLLRLLEARGMASLAHLDDYLVLGEQSPETMTQEAVTVLERHLRQLGYRAHVSERGGAGLAMDYRHGTTPLVSILIASTDGLATLQPCLASIVQRTRYPRYEVLVACAGDAERSEGEALQGEGSRVRLLTGKPDASHDDLLNLAASQARGEYLVLFSETGEVMSPAWLEGLLNEVQRPEVGVVGGALYDSNAALAHAGYQLLAGPRVHQPWLRANQLWQQSVRSCSAVSGGCLMLGKELFEQVGGMQGMTGGDIDLALRVQDVGLMVVWTPQAQVLVKREPVCDAQVAQVLSERWPQAFTGRAFDDGVKPDAGAIWLAAL
ncbi:glycosyltransferase [Pseudomonas guariconensis]|uniref:glycosyltransferase n=1 Tax=Pseudomonas guariconensis TaxID=1288410 RepID=UPI0018AA9ECB|nr:glycosyltransferase [Pseudomonas guariconensis]MBF8722108.1 glycosyltransferase [Pseudomonas guariconensis]